MVSSDIKTLQKLADKRTDKELESLMRHLKDEKFFKEKVSQKLKYYDMKEMASMLTYQKVLTKETLFKYGEFGEKFYIILKGVVRLIAPFGISKEDLIKRCFAFRGVGLDSNVEKDAREMTLEKEFNLKTA